MSNTIGQAICEELSGLLGTRKKSLPGVVLVFLWVTLLLLSVAQSANAATRRVIGDHQLTRWSIDDGLPHNLPLAITQDKKGHIWIATIEGVSRFNGHHFVNFDRRNTAGIDLSGSRSLLAEADGSVLVGTETGVYRFVDDVWSLLHPALANIQIDALTRTPSNELWMASSGQLLRLGNDGALRRFRPEQEGLKILSLSDGPNGGVLLGTDRGLFNTIEGQFHPVPHAQALDGEKILSIIKDTDGWLIASTAGLWRLAGDGKLVAQPFRQHVNFALRGRDKALWINPEHGELMEYLPWGATNYFPMGGLRARVLFVDRDMAVWGGSTEGLFRMDLGAARLLPHGEGYIHAVFEDADGVLWVGHRTGLRRIKDGKTSEVFNVPVLSLAPAMDGNGVWAGTVDRGVIHFDRNGRKVTHVYQDGRNRPESIRAVLQTDDGTVWFGSDTHGLQRWQSGKVHDFPVDKRFSAHAVMMLRPSLAGGVWVGTRGGLAHVDAKDHMRWWAPDQELPARRIYDLLEDADGTVWLASDRGLLRWRDGSFSVFDSQKGLPRERILRLIDDGTHLWMSSTRGLFRVSRQELDQLDADQRKQLHLEMVDQHDGLLGAQVNGESWPAGWLTSDMRLLFPMSDGVAMLVPRELVTQSVPVPVDIERVLVDGLPIYPKGALHVQPGVQRLSFSFTGLEFHAPERVRYRYRLIGFDMDWNKGGTQGLAMYTNLPPGAYQLQVEAMSSPVDWSDRARIGEYQLDVTVEAPWWQHTLSKIVGGVLGLLGVYGLVWLRVTHYRRRQQRLNQIISQRTDELLEKNNALKEAGRERDALVERLAHMALHDALTALPNRRAADAHLKEALDRAAESRGELAVVLIDIDYFKQVNDTYGHDAGDMVLAAVGQLLRSMSESQVFAARQGGEEFLVILENTPVQAVRHWLEFLRQTLEAQPIVLGNGQSVQCTVSGGVAFMSEGMFDARSLLAQADANLYQAKRNGRNRIVG